MSKPVVTVDKESIKKNYEYITSEIDALEHVDFLIETKAITLHDRQRIVAKHSRIKRNTYLIDIILNDTTDNALHFFLKSLKLKSKHVLDKLQKTDSHDETTSQIDVSHKGLQIVTSGVQSPSVSDRARGVQSPPASDRARGATAAGVAAWDIATNFQRLVMAIPGVLSSSVSDRARETEKQQRIENELRQELGQARNAIRILQEERDKAMNEIRILKADKAMNEIRIREERAMNEIRIREERVQERASAIKTQRQENKELREELAMIFSYVTEQEDTIRKLRQENKQLHDKLANPLTFPIKEKSRWPEKETMEDPRRNVKYTRDTLPLGQKENRSSHQKCIPVRDFLLTHLPPCYQHVEMLNLITSLAEISVKIEIEDVNHERKEFWDFSSEASILASKPIDTKIVQRLSYSDMKSASMMKPGSTSTLLDRKMDVNTSDFISSSNLLGSGKVDDVFIRTAADGPCPCDKKCQEWGEIRVLTSAQLMYDDDDAKHFVCTFFYDDDERLDQLKYARGDRIVLRDLKKDVCMFLCVTCDVELVRKLEGMLDKFEQSWEKAFDKYAKTVKWENERMAVLVFHPNGLRKHISLGKSLTTPNVESSEKRIEYDNPTFNGSTGAYVLIPDFNVNDEV